MCMLATTTLTVVCMLKSYVQVMIISKYEVIVFQLPKHTLKGDPVRIKIPQEEYQKGIEDYMNHPHMRLVMRERNKSMIAKDLLVNMETIWKNFVAWTFIPVSKGFFYFVLVLRRIREKCILLELIT